MILSHGMTDIWGQCHQADWERNLDHKSGFSCSKSRFDIIKEITTISRLAVLNPVPRLIYKETLVSKLNELKNLSDKPSGQVLM